MGRCDYDVIFYRVFCLTLLGIAFIFTVMLTNVFVDIDGLLTRKDNTPIIQTTEKIFADPVPDDPQVVKSDLMYKDDDYENVDEMYRSKRSLESKVLINTFIDIKTRNEKNNHTDPKEVKGVIELLFKGIPVKINGINNKEVKNCMKTNINEITDRRRITGTYQNYRKTVMETYTTNAVKRTEDKLNKNKSSKTFVTKVMKDYFKKYYVNYIPKLFDSKSVKTGRKLVTERTKRQVKIKYNLETKNLTKENNTTKNNDDDLYVEIETHFDSKGMKGEKKRKLVREIIDKIRKAIHSEKPEVNKTKKHKHIQVRKRFQNPLDIKHDAILTHEEAAPLETVLHRRIEPIEKFIALEEDVRIRDKFEENWKQPYAGPGFLPASKTPASAQLGEVDVNDSQVMNPNSIPQRYQIPVNADITEEMSNYFKPGNMRFITKDIDGSGFSIGFNQYTDAVPDPEAINFFTGIENLVKAYHQNYDQAMSKENYRPNNVMDNSDKNLKYTDKNDEPHNRFDEHTIIRRSATENDLHSNELKLDFQHLYTQNYKKNTILITNKDHANNTPRNNKRKNIKRFSIDKSKVKLLPFIINDDIFSQHLKPEKIYLSLFNRKKRTIALKKYPNVISKKIKMNRFLNIKKTPAERIFMKKMRNKRNVVRLEVIGSDDTHKRKQSDEQIFVLSDETMLADRATIREIETPEDLEFIDHINKQESQHDFMPFTESSPDLPFAYIHSENPLMSKYPHLFMQEDSHKYDEIAPEVFENLRTHLDNYNYKSQFTNDKKMNLPIITTTTENNIHYTESLPRVGEIVSALSPKFPKTKYKFTVNIIPVKNMTGLNGGFKEIHTSINKSFNNNGLMYSTSVNMSQISKIEFLSKKSNKDIKFGSTTSTTEKPIQLIRKIQSMIEDHNNGVDEQLDQLHKEETHLESMMTKNGTDSNDYTDIMLPLNPPQKVHLRTSDVNKLAASALMILQEQQNTQTPLETETTSVATTIVVTTRSTTTQTTISPERIKILKTIERNDNLTKEILNKIDKNTEMLQIFLVKLSESIANLKQKENQTENNRARVISDNRKEWQVYQPAQMFDKPREINVTNYRIPFLYAYQQPYGVHYKTDSLMASIMYKGHIYANRPPFSVKNKKYNKLKANDNLTEKGRFFIDGIETGYRGITTSNSTKSEPFQKVNNNNTQLRVKKTQ